jgi:hypothetical protein
MILYAALAAGAILSGTYFEARTCSVFAGPCHASGEIVTDGRVAVVAMSLDQGPLAGKAVAALIRSDQNLAFGAARRSVVYLDSAATLAEQQQLRELLLRRAAIDLGTVVATVPARVSLTASGQDASLLIQDESGKAVYSARTSGRKCSACTMPGELWYQPLAKDVDAGVATVEEQSLFDARLGETFFRRDEAAAFVGRFTW